MQPMSIVIQADGLGLRAFAALSSLSMMFPYELHLTRC
ncbi:hypothetical protein GOL30_03995 [Sinorhizobium medicae]|nr:hypothetical protein [Sinorhizobium medicae]MDX0443507.1 hypothetical protein [Sinorhizobium medicae]MDX0461472.1 hypothetical protein [Sinorhizobium medicae]MDX0492817.1 hypothetical protein [Sinorhizobium medicae]MDX0518478.1 hypothetical protein [Sinorhizobium medicae]